MKQQKKIFQDAKVEEGKNRKVVSEHIKRCMQPENDSEKISVPIFSGPLDSVSRSIEKHFDESYDFYLDWIDPVISGFETREVSTGSIYSATVWGKQLTVSTTKEPSGEYTFRCGDDDILITTTVNQSAKTFSYFQAMRVHCDERLGNPSLDWNYLTIVWGDNLSFADGAVQGRINCLFLDPQQGFGGAYNSLKASFFNTGSIRAVCFYDYLTLDSATSGITESSLDGDFQTLKTQSDSLRAGNAGAMMPNEDLMYPIYFITPSSPHVEEESGPGSTYPHPTTFEGAVLWVSDQGKYSGWNL